MQPIGMKKLYPTFIDESAQLFDTICVSAGKIGAQVELAPDALCGLISCQIRRIDGLKNKLCKFLLF